jgi:hypothetical protein
MAVLALVSLILAQVLAPGLKGLSSGLGRYIDAVDIVAGISSHVLALTISAMSIGVLLVVVRDSKISIFIRTLLVGFASLILILGIPASRFRLSPIACFVIGVIAAVLALVGAFQGLTAARSRALAVVLGITGGASFLHVFAAAIASFAPETSIARWVPLSNALAAVSTLLLGLAQLVALLWLASRRRTITSPSTMLALAGSVLCTYAAAIGQKPQASRLFVFLSQGLEHLPPTPFPNFPHAVTIFFAVLGPALALAALLTRRQLPAVIAGFALTLLAGISLDTPAHALIITMATFSTVLASRDEKGDWERLMGRRLG